MIFAADSHARLAIPRSRLDDFLVAQERKWRFKLAQAKESPPLIEAGDLLDLARSDQELEAWLISLFREYGVEIITVPGQHELPEHSMKQYRRSSLRVLEETGLLRVLTKDRGPIIHTNGWAIWGCAWGEEPDESMQDPKRNNMLIWHHMVTQDPMWPTQEVVQPGRLLRLYPWYDLIITGDNHQTVTEILKDSGKNKKGRMLINPGSMMRLKAGQEGHRPCVFRYDYEADYHMSSIKPIYLPIEPDVLDLERLEEEKERQGRFEAFTERLDNPGEIGLDYKENVGMYLGANKVRPRVKELIGRWIG